MAKYCYQCGTEYKEDQCPKCYNDLYTKKPNARTPKFVSIKFEINVILTESSMYTVKASIRKEYVSPKGSTGELKESYISALIDRWVGCYLNDVREYTIVSTEYNEVE